MKTLLRMLMLIFCAGGISAREIVVSPEGEINSLPAARDAVRALRNAGEKGDINVLIQEGIYTLEKTLIFGLEDSAPEGAVTRYRAAEGAHPLISGGRVIKDWEQSDLQGGKIWMAKVPWAVGDAFFHCLYDDGKLMPRAQSKSFPVTATENSYRHYAGELEHRIHFAYKSDILKPWENLEDLELYGQPSRKWLVNYLGIAHVHPEKGTAQLSIPATYTMNGSFVVENCVDHLDTLGEWALNSQEGILYYWPESGTPGDRIIVPALNELIRVEGINDPSAAGDGDQPVEGIVFEGLRFAHADRQKWLPEDQGIQHDWNMWDKDNGLIRFRGARRCAVRDSVFYNSGSDGVRLDLFCQEITVEGCTFKDLGGTGILLSGYGPGKKDVNRNNIIHNNEITRIGRLFSHSPAIFVWQSGHNRISNNHIYDLPYTGMVISGVRRRFFANIFENLMHNKALIRWQFPEGTRELRSLIRRDEIDVSDAHWPSYEPYMHARGNVIEFNEVHDCLKELFDGNAIYLSANGDGNILRHNVTYNHPRGAMIRTDDDSHGVTIHGNLLFGTTGHEGITIKGLNTAQHNILINCQMLTGRAGNTVDPDSLLDRNVFYHTQEPIPQGFHYGMDTVGAGLDYNLYYHEDGSAERLLAEQRQRSKTGKVDLNSVAADPQFVDLVHGDLSFKPGSPAHDMGIQPLPLETIAQMGVSKDPFLKRFKTMPLDVPRAGKKQQGKNELNL